MDRFEARAVDKDFAQWTRFRQIVDIPTIEFERKIRDRLTILVRLVEVRPQRRLHEIEKMTNDAILIEIGNALQTLIDSSPNLHCLLVGCLSRRRIKKGTEQLYDQSRQCSVLNERLLHVLLTKRNPRLSQKLAIGADDHDLSPTQSRSQYQTVEAVAFHLTAPNTAECFLKGLSDYRKIQRVAVARTDFEIMDKHRTAGIGKGKFIRILADDDQAEFLQNR